MASPAMISLSERQIYRYVEGEDVEKPDLVQYSHNYEFPGDLRLVSSTYSQISEEEDKTEYKNIIGKFNTETNIFGRNVQWVANMGTPYIVLARPEQVYLRFAEALMGLEREGYAGAMDLAMVVLKEGVKHAHSILKDPVYEQRYKLNAKGDTIKKYNIDKETNDTLGFEYVMEEYLASYTDSIGYNFTDAKFENNVGIHSRGSGDSERNIYFALDSINVARYFGYTEKVDGNEVITKQLTDEDFRLYMSELILDEMALELAWEGSRFGDLVRVATALGDPDVLAKRIAGRSFKNSVSHRHPEFEFDAALYGKMLNEASWYLPLPGEAVVPGEVVETPDDFNPSEEQE